MNKDIKSTKQDKPPECSFTISQPPVARMIISGGTQKVENLEEEQKTALDMLQKNLESLTKELGESFRQKNIWLIQLITIASTIVGAFMLTKQPVDQTIKIGLGILFIVVFLGLLLIFRENKNYYESILRAIAKQADYGLCLINYLELKQKQNLSQTQQEQKEQCLTYLQTFLKEIGVFEDDGNSIKVGGVSNNLEKKLKKVEMGYILILEFFISMLILIEPKFFENIFGVIWDKLSSIFIIHLVL
jgi:hypothetical protein